MKFLVLLYIILFLISCSTTKKITTNKLNVVRYAKAIVYDHCNSTSEITVSASGGNSINVFITYHGKTQPNCITRYFIKYSCKNFFTSQTPVYSIRRSSLNVNQDFQTVHVSCNRSSTINTRKPSYEIIYNSSTELSEPFDYEQ